VFARPPRHDAPSVAAEPSTDAAALDHYRLPTLLAVARHAAPTVVVSTIVPTCLFYVGWYAQGKAAAFALALGWALTVIAWRSVRRQRVPALLALTTSLLVVRTIIAIMSGSTRLYFMQPVVTTALIGFLFLISIAAGRPLISRLAVDFCPLPAGISERADIQHHFRNLSFLWAGVYFSNATVTLLLLLNLPVTTFVATKTLTTLFITWSGIALTVSWSYRVARRVGLLRATKPSPASPALAAELAAAA
jgi:intracellular septation protein A